MAYNENYNGTMAFSDTCLQMHLLAGVAQDYTVPGPAGAKLQAFFKYTDDSNVYVCNNGTASYPPAGTATTQAYNQFKPDKCYVTAGDVLSLITPDTAAFVGVSFRQIQGN